MTLSSRVKGQSESCLAVHRRGLSEAENLGVVGAEVTWGTGQAQKRPRTDSCDEQVVGRCQEQTEKQPREGRGDPEW